MFLSDGLRLNDGDLISSEIEDLRLPARLSVSLISSIFSSSVVPFCSLNEIFLVLEGVVGAGGGFVKSSFKGLLSLVR